MGQRYVAICNKTNFDGHYIKVFEVPEDQKGVSPSWYFCNMVDFEACVASVHPLELFNDLLPVLSPSQADIESVLKGS
jgi:hypothetical protein